MRALHFIGWLALSACSASGDVPVPAIAGVQPDRGMPGTLVTVSGSYLCQQPRVDGSDVDPLACEHMGTVMFGTAPSVVTSYTDTMAIVEVPPVSPGNFDLVVAVAGRSSNRISFVVE